MSSSLVFFFNTFCRRWDLRQLGSPGQPDVPLSKRADLPTLKTVEKPPPRKKTNRATRRNRQHDH